MGIFTSISNAVKSFNATKEVNEAGQDVWFYEKMGNILNENVRFSDDVAFLLALSLSEIYNPIDLIANRTSTVKFDLVDLKGNVIEPKFNIARLMTNPNPFQSFSDLVYDIVFSGLADGNKWIYNRMPQVGEVKVDKITNCFCLKPNLLTVNELSNINNYLALTDYRSIINYLQYDFQNNVEKLDKLNITHSRTFLGNRANSLFIAQSPLNTVKRNINNLIAVYQARLNVYDNNGTAGILAKKQAASNGNDQLQQAVDPITQDQMAEEINKRFGLTGNRNIKGISSIPLEFIKTLATISELQPFEETEADAIQIAAIYGVDRDLVNSKNNSAYENKKNAEKGLWQNVIIQEAFDVADLLTKSWNLTDKKLQPNFDNIAILKEDKKTNAEAESIIIDNLIKINSLPDNKQFIKDLEKYTSYERS